MTKRGGSPRAEVAIHEPIEIARVHRRVRRDPFAAAMDSAKIAAPEVPMPPEHRRPAERPITPRVPTAKPRKVPPDDQSNDPPERTAKHDRPAKHDQPASGVQMLMMLDLPAKADPSIDPTLSRPMANYGFIFTAPMRWLMPRRLVHVWRRVWRRSGSKPSTTC